MSVTLVCHYVPCSKVFPIKPYKANRPRFCSPTCYHQWKTAQQFATFWDKVQICIHGFDCIFCCWPWEGTTENVYKNTTIKNKFVLVHRLAWKLGNNCQIPEGLHIAHYCHFRPCCNFMHLHAATQQQNSDDSVRDHRMLSGDQHPNSKLTTETATKALDLYAAGFTLQAIAHHLNITRSAIEALCYGRTWKHLPRPIALPRPKRGPRPRQFRFFP